MVDVHTQMMQLALQEAQKAFKNGEVPVGAVVYLADGTVLAVAHNEVEQTQNPTAHAEFLACERARKKLESPYLTECSVAVTLEPCAMCAQALSYYRIREIRFGAYDVKSGGTENGARVLAHAHHKPRVLGGILEEECKNLLKTFFKEKR